MLVIILLYLRIITVACLNDSDEECGLGEECVPSSQCYHFTRIKDFLSTLSPNNEDYKELLLNLKSKVCNKKLKKVCCGIFQLNLNHQIECEDDSDCPETIPDPHNSTVTQYFCQKPFQPPQESDPTDRGHVTLDPHYKICIEKVENICCSEYFDQDPSCKGERRQGTCTEIFGGHPLLYTSAVGGISRYQEPQDDSCPCKTNLRDRGKRRRKCCPLTRLGHRGRILACPRRC